MLKPLRKAVFPVAGLGTRFLPATKANPKEMLPIVDKPLLQYAVEEAIEAGCVDLIFVTNSAKYSIEDYFDSNYELESRLELAGKKQVLEILQNILPAGVNCVYIRQAEPKGLGDAVMRAARLIGNEPFAVLLADDLLDCPGNAGGGLKQMIQHMQDVQASVIAVEEIDRKRSKDYGIVDLQSQGQVLSPIKTIIEKPEPEKAPSNLGVIGRYIFTPKIFQCLQTISPGANGELQLTDAIAKLLHEEPVYAFQFEGRRFDCGSKLGYLKATVELGLRHAEAGEEFGKYLRGLKF